MTPSAISWTTTQAGSGYETLLGPLNEYDRDVYVYGVTSIITPNIPANGDLSFDWELVGVVNTVGVAHTMHASNSVGWQMVTRSIFTTNDQGISNETTSVRAVNPSVKIKSNLSYQLPEMNIFTGNGEQGSLVRVVSFGGYEIKYPHTDWREGNSGTYLSIQKLVCQEFLKIMDQPTQRYMGQMFSSHDFRTRLFFDNNYWIQLGGTFNANLDTWDGEWFVIRRASVSTTFEDTSTVSGSTASFQTSGLTGNTTFGGIDAVNVDANLLDVTTTASIGGATTIGSTLGVTGLSTLASTSVGAFTTTNQVAKTVNSISGGPGGA